MLIFFLQITIYLLLYCTLDSNDIKRIYGKNIAEKVVNDGLKLCGPDIRQLLNKKKLCPFHESKYGISYCNFFNNEVKLLFL